jgi:hypothetical protein
VFDDTDWTTLRNGPEVYRVLTDMDVRITKSVWMHDPGPVRTTGGGTCEDPEYLSWVLELRAAGHEIGFHNATDCTSSRKRTIAALDRFEDLFGHPPRVGADHAGNREALYGGAGRLTGARRAAYLAAVRALNPTRPRFEGADPASPLFWGDVARERIDYWRRFTWSGTDVSRRSPVLYRDPITPYVPAWFDSVHAPRLEPFLACLAPERLEQLSSGGGVCIAYTHFGVDFVDDVGRVDPRFIDAVERLRSLDGWFAPVSDVLDHLGAQRGVVELDDDSRSRLERDWILDRLRSRSRFGPRVITHEVRPR